MSSAGMNTLPSRLDGLRSEEMHTPDVRKDELKQLWRRPSTEAASAAWQDWINKAQDSAIPPVPRFARKLQAYMAGIVATAMWPLNTSIPEGINNRIKVIKRMAYGFRDDACFFLKIRAAFPGKT